MKRKFSITDEEWATKPSEHALSRAINLIAGAFELARIRLPSPYLSIAQDGGIRIQWIKDDISLRVIIPAVDGKQEYIYFESGSDYGTENVSPDNLAARFFWLIERWPNGVNATQRAAIGPY